MGLEPGEPRSAWGHRQKPEQHQFIGLVTDKGHPRCPTPATLGTPQKRTATPDASRPCLPIPGDTPASPHLLLGRGRGGAHFSWRRKPSRARWKSSGLSR